MIYADYQRDSHRDDAYAVRQHSGAHFARRFMRVIDSLH